MKPFSWFAYITVLIIIVFGIVPLYIKWGSFKDLSSKELQTKPILVGTPSESPGDIIRKKLYFLFPLTDPQIDFLNGLLIKNTEPPINYWSLTHLMWGVAARLSGMGLTSTFLIHTIFEVWEALAFGYFIIRPFDSVEAMDSVLDTIFAVIGYVWTYFSPYTAIIFSLLLIARIFSH
jgi:hypothetical protein